MKRLSALLILMIFSIKISFAISCISVDDLTGSSQSLAEKINQAISASLKKHGYAYVKFTKGETYIFSRSIILRDNVTIDGNGCVIRFNTRQILHAMYPYNSFLTNRQVKGNGQNINNFSYHIFGDKNIVIKNIDFECQGDNQFWFNVNCERGIIALRGVNGLKIDNVTFNQVQHNTPIWIGDIKNAEISHCVFKESLANKGQNSSCGGIWTNVSSYLNNIRIHDNVFVNYRDESISIFSEGKEPLRYVDRINIYNNVFNSRYYAITMSGSNASGTVNIHDNHFNDFDNQACALALEVGGSYKKLNIANNIFNSQSEKSVVAVVANIAIDSLVFENNKIAHGNLTYSYLPLIRKLCKITGNTFYNASTILSLTCCVPMYVEHNIFHIQNAKNGILFNINNEQEHDIIENNEFDIRESDGVMLLAKYGYGYSLCKNRLAFMGNKVNFQNTSTPFFHNDEDGKIITMSIFGNIFHGLSRQSLMKRTTKNCKWN